MFITHHWFAGVHTVPGQVHLQSIPRPTHVRVRGMRWGEQPLPIKNKNSLKVFLSLIGFFQKINLKSCGQTESG